jgi:hypothetical protein
MWLRSAIARLDNPENIVILKVPKSRKAREPLDIGPQKLGGVVENII